MMSNILYYLAMFGWFIFLFSLILSLYKNIEGILINVLCSLSALGVVSSLLHLGVLLQIITLWWALFWCVAYIVFLIVYDVVDIYKNKCCEKENKNGTD